MLPFPANGWITYDPVTKVACHSCDPGYAPSNTGQRMCQSNNQWSGTTVTCERMRRCVSACVLTHHFSTHSYYVSNTLKP